jgi:hypothetical protein
MDTLLFCDHSETFTGWQRVTVLAGLDFPRREPNTQGAETVPTIVSNELTSLVQVGSNCWTKTKIAGAREC